MARHTVTTPVAGYHGTVGGVTFVDGTAVVDDETHAAELAYFRGAGYDIAPEGAPSAPAEPEPATEMPKKSASTEAWRTWAVEHGGMDQYEADEYSRDELVAHFTTEDPA